MERLLYTPEQAADVLGIGRTKVFQLMAEGAVQSVQIGRSRRITRDSLERFVKTLAVPQDAA